MSVNRVHRKESPWSQILNEGVHDTRLSWAGRGILWYLLTKPDGWQVRTEHLAKQSDVDGLRIVKAGLRNLEVNGYLIRWCDRGEGGRLQWKSEIFESIELANTWREDNHELLENAVRFSAGTAQTINTKVGNGEEDDTIDPSTIDTKTTDGQPCDGKPYHGQPCDGKRAVLVIKDEVTTDLVINELAINQNKQYAPCSDEQPAPPTLYPGKLEHQQQTENAKSLSEDTDTSIAKLSESTIAIKDKGDSSGRQGDLFEECISPGENSQSQTASQQTSNTRSNEERPSTPPTPPPSKTRQTSSSEEIQKKSKKSSKGQPPNEELCQSIVEAWNTHKPNGYVKQKSVTQSVRQSIKTFVKACKENEESDPLLVFTNGLRFVAEGDDRWLIERVWTIEEYLSNKKPLFHYRKWEDRESRRAARSTPQQPFDLELHYEIMTEPPPGYYSQPASPTPDSGAEPKKRDRTLRNKMQEILCQAKGTTIEQERMKFYTITPESVAERPFNDPRIK